MTHRLEILEQPAILESALEEKWDPVVEIADQLRELSFRYVIAVGRGSSANAARYAAHVLGERNQLFCAQGAPSLLAGHSPPPALPNALLLVMTQSGESPDLLASLQAARRQNRPSLTITNHPESPVAQRSDLVFDVGAGEESSIPASKTYTAQLLAVAMLSAAMAGETQDQLDHIPRQVAEVIRQEDHIKAVSERLIDRRPCVVVGRAYNYSTAREWALKLQEVGYVPAHAYSAAEFRHGHTAILEPGFPVCVVASDGPWAKDMANLVRYLKHQKRAEVVAISSIPEIIATADGGVPLPDGAAEWTTPFTATVAAQLLSYHVGARLGVDTKQPRGLSKITRTR